MAGKTELLFYQVDFYFYVEISPEHASRASERPLLREGSCSLSRVNKHVSVVRSTPSLSIISLLHVLGPLSLLSSYVLRRLIVSRLDSLRVRKVSSPRE